MLLSDIKWATRQRLQYIELMAYFAGVVSRSDVAKAFGISDAAATKDLKLYNDIAPENLIYKHAVFGFIPSKQFKEVFADFSPAVVLPLLESNLTLSEGPYGNEAIFDIRSESLPLPARYPDKAVLAEITRSIKSRNKLNVQYHSLSERDSDAERIIEPHSLVNTGFRWHVRAYNEETFDFRDFVLSRFVSAKQLNQAAESDASYDDDWVEHITIHLQPHPNLAKKKQAILLYDYGAVDGVISVTIRRAMIVYLLQRMDVDTSNDHSMNPNKYPLIIMNQDEIEPFASWAFEN